MLRTNLELNMVVWVVKYLKLGLRSWAIASFVESFEVAGLLLYFLFVFFTDIQAWESESRGAYRSELKGFTLEICEVKSVIFVSVLANPYLSRLFVAEVEHHVIFLVYPSVHYLPDTLKILTH